jgi:hypothetical protein
MRNFLTLLFTTFYYDDQVRDMGEGRNLYRVLVGKPEGKRPL